MRATATKQGSGQILLPAALLLTVLVGFVGLVIDAGVFFAQRRQVQNVADLAALAGARVLFEGGDDTAAVSAAREYAQANGYPLTSSCPPICVPPVSGDHIGDTNFVELIIEEEPTTFFIQTLIPSAGTVKGRGVAGTAPFPEPYALVALDPNDCRAFEQAGDASLTVVGGGIMVNSSCANNAFSKGGSGNLLVDGSIDVHGGVNTNGNSGLITPDPNPNVPWTVADPLAGLPPPSLGSPAPGSPGTQANPQTWKITSPGVYTLQPGTYYGGLEINCSNCVITLEEGVYIMAGGGFTKAGNPVIQGDEVMIYATDCNGPTDSTPCSGDGRAAPVKLTGGGVLDLSPPTSGLYQGITFWQDQQITADFSIRGDNGLVQGIFYAPSARLDLGGGATLGVVQLVANSIRVSGNAPLNLTYGEFRTFEAPEVTLVE